MVKSLFTAYICWLFGGIFGLHLLYLGRDRQAFIYLSTFGGFLISYMYDFYRMPSYVHEANLDTTFITEINKLHFKLKSPAFQSKRFFSCLIVGVYFSYLVNNCVKSEENFSYLSTHWALQLLQPLVVAFVVYYAGTNELMDCQFRWPLLGSYLGAFLGYYLKISESLMYLTSPLLTTFIFNWNLSWEKKFINKKKDKLLKRSVKFIILSSLFILLFGIFCWNNVKLNGKNGETLTLKESATAFIESEQFKQISEAVIQLYNFYKVNGFWKTIDQLFYNGDSGAISRAYEVSCS